MNYWNNKLIIGPYLFPRFIGGPLDGITDSPFRRLVREFSKEELLYTEMRHVASLIHAKNSKALDVNPIEHPLNFQIGLNKTDFIKPACEKILAAGFNLVDLNIGCPARNVVCSGGGSALMADLPRLKLIVATLRQALGSIPLTVKMRAGFKEKNAIEVAQLLQDCGINALAIHPRLQTQMFAGQPDYVLVAQIKKVVNIPVLLSGNVVNWKTAKLAYEQTGADGFLIGRGIWGRPWKLAELAAHSQGKEYTVDLPMVLGCAIKHFEYMLDYYGNSGLYCFRKHLPFYVRGFPEAATLRSQLVTSQSVDEVKEGLIRALAMVSVQE